MIENHQKVLTINLICDIICKAICFTAYSSKVISLYQKDLNMSYLLDFYGEAIPQKQNEIMTQYYDEDLSLSEIAENFGISRQGARHLIKKGEEQLLFLENKLGLAKIHKNATQNYETFIKFMDELESQIISVDSNKALLECFYSAKEAAKKIVID